MVVGRFLRARLGIFGCSAGSALLAGATGGVTWAITGEAALGIILAIAAFILGLFGGALRGDGGSGSGWSSAMLGQFGASAGIGGATGGVVWAITGEAVPGIFFAIVGFVWGLSNFSVGSSGGSSSGRSWSGGSSGGSSGGGFSGGGGSFSGGGASSDW